MQSLNRQRGKIKTPGLDPVEFDRAFHDEACHREKSCVPVLRLDRATGAERWHVQWKGSLSVPFFAASNGSWIRSTPCVDGDRVYVAGMRELGFCSFGALFPIG